MNTIGLMEKGLSQQEGGMTRLCVACEPIITSLVWQVLSEIAGVCIAASILTSKIEGQGVKVR